MLHMNNLLEAVRIVLRDAAKILYCLAHYTLYYYREQSLQKLQSARNC